MANEPPKPPDNVVPMRRPRRSASGATSATVHGVRLHLSPKGAPRTSVANALSILTTHAQWAGVLAHDEFRTATLKRRAPPVRPSDRGALDELGEWSDADTVRTSAWLSEMFGVDFGREAIDSAVTAAAEQAPSHEVRDYLRALRWDATDRLPGLAANYLGTAPTAFARAAGTAWMISAVARIFRPGCQADHLLVLEGPQGAGKTSALRRLAGPWLCESPIDLVDAREAGQSLRGAWIVAFDELDALRRAEMRRVKAFLTSAVDTYRPSYGRRVLQVPRQCVFAATTNEAAYLSDSTGNRRFWPLKCGSIDLAALERDRDQLWAEAVARFDRGEPWHLTGDLEREAKQEQAQREEEDPWSAAIASWLEAPATKANFPKGVTTSDVLTGALSLDAHHHSRANSTRIGELLRRMGYDSKQAREGLDRVRRYTASRPGTTVPLDRS